MSEYVVSFPSEWICLRQFITFHPWQYHRRVDKLLQTGGRLTLTHCLWVCAVSCWLFPFLPLIYESYFPALERKKCCTDSVLYCCYIVRLVDQTCYITGHLLPQCNRTGDSLEQRFRMFYTTSSWSGCRGLISLLVFGHFSTWCWLQLQHLRK